VISAEFVECFRIAVRVYDCEVESVARGKRTVTIDHADAWNALAIVKEMRGYLPEVKPRFGSVTADTEDHEMIINERSKT